jgi:DNA polymerase III subunit gamma/tau
MGYISLYRKYRSRTFDEIVGQAHITTTLKNAIERNRIAHAYLFSGPRGTGKTSNARILAKSVNCLNGPTPTPCNACENCIAINTDSLFDVVEIDAASNRGIDDIRDLREKVRIPPIQARFKVYIIDEVHMLTKEAFNALLKTLEEPPQHVIFILATTEPQKLPSTILSRCQRFDFRRLTDLEIRGHINWIAGQENFSIEDSALDIIVKTADGSLRDAISILDQLVSFSDGRITGKDVNQMFGLPERQEVAKFLDSIFSGDIEASFKLFNEFFSAGKSFSLFVRLLLEYFRDLYLIKQQIRPPAELYSDEELRPLIRQAGAVQRQTIVSLLDEIARVEDRIRWETYPRIILEILLIKLIDTISAPTPAEMPRPEPKDKTSISEQARKIFDAEAARAPEEKKAVAPAPPTPDPAPPAAKKETPPQQPAATDKKIEPPPMAPVGDPDLQAVRDAWLKTLEIIRQNNLPTYFLTAPAVPACIEGTAITLEYEADKRFQMEKISEDKYIKEIESAFQQTLGRSVRVKVRLGQDDSGGAAAVAETPAAAQQRANAPATPAVDSESDFMKSQPRKAQAMSLFDTLTDVFPGSSEIK